MVRKTKNRKLEIFQAGIFIIFLIIGILSFLYSICLFVLKLFHKDDDYSIYKSEDDCEKTKPLSIYTKPSWYNNKCNAGINPLTDPLFVGGVSFMAFTICTIAAGGRVGGRVGGFGAPGLLGY